MATALDLQEQEQIDALKAFWSRWGTLITWALVLVLGAFAAYNAWNLWQRKQAEAAAVLYDQMLVANLSDDHDKAALVFGDLKSRFGGTVYASNAGLLAARIQAKRGLPDEALKSLAWVSENAADVDVKGMARLQAAGVLLDKKLGEDALKQLELAGKLGGSLGALVDDRRGDAWMSLSKPTEAKAAYEAAYAAMDEKLEYRQLIEAKLAALGTAPIKKAAVPAAASSANTAN